MDPVVFQSQYKNNQNAKGGGDFLLSKNIILPKKSLNLIEEDKTKISDLKLKDRLSYYIVRKGDTVEKIAKRFGVSKNTIIWENNLSKNGFLKLGQKLTILPVSGIRYKVKKGDTLSKIAKKTKAKMKEIESVNQIKNNRLKVGEYLLIPNGQKEIIKKKIYKKKAKISTYKTKKNIKISKSPLSKLFIKPSKGRFTSGFGRRWHKFHYGVDFASYRGSAVVAAASGVVVKTYSGCRVGNSHCGGGYGNNIVIQHDNGYQTRYAHLISIKVRTGQRVVQGQLIGGMGNTGHVVPRPTSYKSTKGTHLHFEIIKNGRKISPNFLKYK